ncbi:MAG TPA: hypothetical protein DIW44_00720 [Anaerolineaceae bacterium]|nr:hypothetical protein [Anaerolineaceae bacterium]
MQVILYPGKFAVYNKKRAFPRSLLRINVLKSYLTPIPLALLGYTEFAPLSIPRMERGRGEVGVKVKNICSLIKNIT